MLTRRMNDPPCILIVDDEPSVLLTYELILRQQGFVVTSAATSAEAVAALRQGRFDVVICDLQLESQRGGFDVINEARRHDPKLPAVLLTGYATTEAAEEALQKNITVVYKPVDVQEFLPLLARLARRQEP